MVETKMSASAGVSWVFIRWVLGCIFVSIQTSLFLKMLYNAIVQPYFAYLPEVSNLNFYVIQMIEYRVGRPGNHSCGPIFDHDIFATCLWGQIGIYSIAGSNNRNKGYTIAFCNIFRVVRGTTLLSLKRNWNWRTALDDWNWRRTERFAIIEKGTEIDSWQT